MGPATSGADARVLVSSPTQLSRQTCLIIVARDRPDLFQHLTESYGQELKVIVDRRQRPRPPRPECDPSPSSFWYATMEREGFMVVPTWVTKVEAAA